MTIGTANLLATQIDQILPQTQCTQCGYNGCLPYANAISRGTPHNQCPPGGARVIAELSALLNRPLLPLNPNNGVEKPRVLAFIREADCIGCTKCIQACPTDAILGSSKWMHTVIADECTGCGLCVEPCPVDCIDLIPAPAMPYNSDHYRARHHARNARLKRIAAEQNQHYETNKNVLKADKNNTLQDKRAFIAEALIRAQSRKADKGSL